VRCRPNRPDVWEIEHPDSVSDLRTVTPERGYTFISGYDNAGLRYDTLTWCWIIHCEFIFKEYTGDRPHKVTLYVKDGDLLSVVDGQ
jgi:hypothetical protein